MFILLKLILYIMIMFRPYRDNNLSCSTQTQVSKAMIIPKKSNGFHSLKKKKKLKKKINRGAPRERGPRKKKKNFSPT